MEMNDEQFKQLMEFKERKRKEEKRDRTMFAFLFLLVFIGLLILAAVISYHCPYGPCPCRGIEENAIHKRVVVDADGSPIQDANVSLYYNGDLYDWKHTSSSGWANWTGLNDGLWTIEVDAEDDGDIEKCESNILWDGEAWELTNHISPELHGCGQPVWTWTWENKNNMYMYGGTK